MSEHFIAPPSKIYQIHVFSKVDSEGKQYCFFKESINHRKYKNALDSADCYCIQTYGKRIQKKSLTGWNLEVE
jgi:hypothetical protein